MTDPAAESANSRDTMTPETVARRSALALAANDKVPQSLGITIESVNPGEAILTMTVTDAMTSGHGLCHGGFLFTLADCAFAYACNTYRSRAVAQQCSITFVAPVRSGTTLVAIARERHRAERSGLYDVTIRVKDGDVVAEFRGHSRTVPGTLF